MSQLTEHEILDRMAESFRVAAECADLLAVLPAQGPTYSKLREHLGLVEGCCRQAGHWREDSRWFPVGLFCAKVRQGALQLILGHNPRQEFTQLAAVLRKGEKQARDLRDKAPPKLGTILPDPLEGPLRQGRPVQVLTPANDTEPTPGLLPGSVAGGQALGRSVRDDPSAPPPTKLIIPDGVTVH